MSEQIDVFERVAPVQIMRRIIFASGKFDRRRVSKGFRKVAALLARSLARTVRSSPRMLESMTSIPEVTSGSLLGILSYEREGGREGERPNGPYTYIVA